MTNSIDECDRLTKDYIKTFKVKDIDAFNVVATCGDEQAIEKENQGLKKIDPKSNSEVTTRLRHTILSVNGDYNPKTIREFIEYGFLAKDSRAFREHFNSISPGINLKYTYTFDNGVEEDITVPVGVNFFWPDA